MTTPTPFRKIDSYMSALCIGVAATVSFWFLFIGVILGFTDSAEQKPSFCPFPYVLERTHDAGAFPTLHARHAPPVIPTGRGLS